MRLEQILKIYHLWSIFFSSYSSIVRERERNEERDRERLSFAWRLFDKGKVPPFRSMKVFAQDQLFLIKSSLFFKQKFSEVIKIKYEWYYFSKIIAKGTWNLRTSLNLAFNLFWKLENNLKRWIDKNTLLDIVLIIEMRN